MFLGHNCANMLFTSLVSYSSVVSGISPKIVYSINFSRIFCPPSRLWHWWGVQNAENLRTQAGILALCTTGYREVSQHKLLCILCRTEAKSWHLEGSVLGQQPKFSQLFFKVTEWFFYLCRLWVDSLSLKSLCVCCLFLHAHCLCFDNEQWIGFYCLVFLPRSTTATFFPFWIYQIACCSLQALPLNSFSSLLSTLPI